MSTIQCGGNRRSEMSNIERTNGTPWGVAAIANAKWTGVRLRDLLIQQFGLSDEIVESLQGSTDEKQRIRHVHFISHDGS